MTHRAITLTITYEIVTPESAEQGDTADHGFESENGDRFSLTDRSFRRKCAYYARKGCASGHAGAVQAQSRRAGEIQLTLREAVKYLRDKGPLEPSQWPTVDVRHAWLSQSEPDENYKTGNVERNDFHPRGKPRALRALYRALGFKVQE